MAVIPGWSAGPDPESRDSGFDAEPVIGPRFARTRWHRPGMTSKWQVRSNFARRPLRLADVEVYSIISAQSDQLEDPYA